MACVAQHPNAGPPLTLTSEAPDGSARVTESRHRDGVAAALTAWRDHATATGGRITETAPGSGVYHATDANGAVWAVLRVTP